MIIIDCQKCWETQKALGAQLNTSHENLGPTNHCSPLFVFPHPCHKPIIPRVMLVVIAGHLVKLHPISSGLCLCFSWPLHNLLSLHSPALSCYAAAGWRLMRMAKKKEKRKKMNLPPRRHCEPWNTIVGSLQRSHGFMSTLEENGLFPAEVHLWVVSVNLCK